VRVLGDMLTGVHPEACVRDLEGAGPERSSPCLPSLLSSVPLTI